MPKGGSTKFQKHTSRKLGSDSPAYHTSVCSKCFKRYKEQMLQSEVLLQHSLLWSSVYETT